MLVRQIRSASLLTKFAIGMAIPIALLGLSLGLYLRTQIREDALGQSTRLAELVARLEVEPNLSPRDLVHGLGPAKRRAIDAALHKALVSTAVTRIKIWSRNGKVIYSDDHRLVGRRFPVSHDLEEALEGKIESEVADPGDKPESAEDAGRGQLLEVYVPLRPSSGDRPAGVLELYLPYQPIANRIAARTWEVALLLLVGLTLLYAVLFRVVAVTSKRLRTQAATLRRQAAENQHQALHDALTGLPNRTLFQDRVRQAILAANRDGSAVAVLIMDLDRFKEINDTLGHHTGDLLLKQIGPRIRDALRESDTIARLGGDEFAVLAPGIRGRSAAAGVADTITASLDEPFDLPHLTVHSDASIGIALYPEHGDDAETLLQRADVAMYEAKRTHRPHAVYTARHDPYSATRLALVAELRHALDAGELLLHYQPKVDLRSGKVTGVEALVRWRHPQRGLLAPSEFVSLAEHTGLIRPLTVHVLDLALCQCRAWRQAGLALSVAVNLSASNLLDHELVDTVRALLEKREVSPEWLELEITESTVMADPMRARGVLTRLHTMGVRLAIDDFGTGHSSLAYLKRLPVDEVKLDRSFVTDMDADGDDAVIVRSTIELGRNLGLRVVAEGVETAEASGKLTALGCDLAQGHYYSRPLPAVELEAWLTGPWLGDRGHAALSRARVAVR